jgi:RNA polymerase sigma-70 factor, ECF subfamily
LAEIQREWLIAARKGDTEAFAKVVEAFQTPVFNLCYRMLGDATFAEDAAQESFWRAYKGLGKYDFQRSFGTWMLSIAAHYCIDQLRRKRLSAVSLEDLLPEEDAPDPAPRPETIAVQNERGEAVQRLLLSLAPEDRAMIVMRYWYDMSYEEIGGTLSCTVSAVKSRLHRARKTLAEQCPAVLRWAGGEHAQP